MVIREAVAEDLSAVVRLLAADSLTGKREKYSVPLAECYEKAFREIMASSCNELLVAEVDGAVVGTLQLTFIPYLTNQGGKRALVEAVFVDEQRRGQGIGRKMMVRAIERAREENCRMVQLTTNKSRPQAHRFYESLGFVGTHVGMKLFLEP